MSREREKTALHSAQCERNRVTGIGHYRENKIDGKDPTTELYGHECIKLKTLHLAINAPGLFFVCVLILISFVTYSNIKKRASIVACFESFLVRLKTEFMKLKDKNFCRHGSSNSQRFNRQNQNGGTNGSCLF